MKKILIATQLTPEDGYEDYFSALKALGAEGFASLDTADLEKADGMILPGSTQDMNPRLWGEEDRCSNDINDELDSAQWALMDKAVELGKPVLGICRGMQFINVYFGGTLIQDLDSAEQHRGTEPENYHLIFHKEGQFTKELFGGFTQVNSRHHQGTGTQGAGIEQASFWIGGETGDIVTEAIAHEKYPIIGVQWHPEKMFMQAEAQGHIKEKEDGRKLIEYFLNL